MFGTFVLLIFETHRPRNMLHNLSRQYILRGYPQFQMQLICLLVGVWSLRNVRRQRVVSASLFDQRRMRIQGSSNSGGVHGSSNSTSNGNYSSRLRNNSFELTRQQNQQKHTGYAKVPKSPAPDFNGLNSNNMQTV